MRRSVFVIGMSLIIAAGLSPAQDSPANPLAGKRFLSLQKLPGGDRADGTVNQINWVVQFKDRSYSWLRSDTRIAGTYDYDTRTGVVKTGDPKIGGSYDAKTGILTWGKHKYRATKDAR